MKAAVHLLRNFIRPGLVRTMNYQSVPTCLRTSVPCMHREESPCVLGDMSVMPGTIGTRGSCTTRRCEIA